MIDEQYFLSLPFPWLLRSSSGVLIAEGDGALFPADSKASRMDRQYLLAPDRTLGWSECPSGFAAYVASTSETEDSWLVIYSLKIFGVSSVQGKQSTRSIKLSDEELESYVARTISSLRGTKGEMNSIMRDSIHEVRSINSDIYHAAYELRTNVATNDFVQHHDISLIRNVEELSQLLRTRTDVLDVLSNPTVLNSSTSRIPVYRAFDRIVRSLSPTANSKRVQLKLDGASRGYIRSSRFFDVLPYLVIQNAIKYAPNGSQVVVEFSETTRDIVIVVSSTGPVVLPSERQRLFLSGFRGKHARVASQEGTGIGLYVLKRLVELHKNGSVDFDQSPQIRAIQSVPYAPTRLTIRLALDHETIQ